jgi:hypothetical protein
MQAAAAPRYPRHLAQFSFGSRVVKVYYEKEEERDDWDDGTMPNGQMIVAGTKIWAKGREKKKKRI